MDVPFGTSAYSRQRGNIAELPVVNMMAEAAPSEGRVILQSRPGIELYAEYGEGPVHGLYRRDGVLAGALFTVSGSTLYKASTSLGAIAVSGPVSWAGSELELCVNAGGAIYATNGTTLSVQAFPDSADVIKVWDLAGYVLAIKKDTARFHWRLIGVSTWDALDYATAENEPDKLLDAVAIDDYNVLFGTETIEFWPKTGDLDLPFAPTQGRVFEKGIRATGCAAAFDNTVAWVSGDHIVYRAGNVPDRISDSGIEERIEKSGTCSVFSFFWEGHELLAVRLDTGTWLYDAQTGEWCEWASYGRVNFAGQNAIQGPLFGDFETGKIFQFSSGFTDDGGVLERRFRAGFPLEQAVGVMRVRLSGNSGQTGQLTGDYADPVIECRTSRDAGQTWSTWRSAPLGKMGKYRQRIEFRRFGTFDDPAFLIEFRVTDPVPFRSSRVQVNPKTGGRSR